MRRTLSRPAPASRSEAALLQRGNRAAPPLVAPRFSQNFSNVPIRTKLKVGAAGDAFEREADRVADQVMKTPESRVQRECACGGSCGDCSGSKDDEPPAVRRKASSGESIASANGVENVVRGSGAPLDAATRAFMEPRFGRDLAGVRVHTGTEAAASAASMKARAYTVGHDIVFGSGEYRPRSAEGQRLLAHELTHVTQQSDGNGSRIQRKMTLTNPSSPAPQPEDFMGPPLTRALALQTWLDELCSGGKFVVNPSSGAVTSVARGSFCRTTSRAGCGCLCTATSTAPGSKDIEIQIDEKITFFDSDGSSDVALEEEIALADTGGAATAVGRESAVVAVRGDIDDLSGAGDTSPKKPGAGSRNQILRTPDWLAFGHELCGHALLQKGKSKTAHLVTAEGNRSATDVENQLRREHSTVKDSLGIRHGVFNGDSDFGPIERRGAAFRVEAGDTLPGIAARVGIPASSMLDHIWRFDGSRITEETKNTIATGEEVLIEEISWHTVIQGETVTSIAELWRVPPDSLLRANPKIAGPEAVLRPGTRLLIPVR